MRLLVLFVLTITMSEAANYSAQRVTVDSIEVIRLADAARQIEVSVVPSIGNNAYEMKVKGHNILWSAYATLAELKAKPVQVGNPLLAPWANRIDQDAYWVNGKKFLLNPAIPNFRRDPNGKPLHGVLQFVPWKVVRMEAGAREAVVTSRLEFWRNPEWMAQFPFAHDLEMTYRLADGALEVETAVQNLSTSPMPVSLGYHTYYRLTDLPRDEWRAHLSVRDEMVLSDLLIPTGERRPVKFPDSVQLKEAKFDSVYANLIRDPQGWATFWVQGKTQKISVIYGPKYSVAVVFAPDDPARQFICFEPMSGPTNVFNLNHAGLYSELQSVPPGGTWRESFWIRPEGF